ncbi:MAG: hypothetical protein ACYDCG_17670 [Candidatus Acidiferrales bacterium]
MSAPLPQFIEDDQRVPRISVKAVTKPNLQKGLEIFSQLEAQREIIRTSLYIFLVQKMHEEHGK